MNRSLLLAVTAACLAASAANAAPADRYSYGPAAPAAEIKPLWKRIIALEWIERAPRLAPAYPASAPVQSVQMAAVSATPQRLPGGLYSKAISQVQSAPAQTPVLAPAAAPSAPAQASLTGLAPAVDPRPRQAPQLP